MLALIVLGLVIGALLVERGYAEREHRRERRDWRAALMARTPGEYLSMVREPRKVDKPRDDEPKPMPIGMS